MAMDFNELKAKIDEVNAQVQTLNNTRLQNLGKRETLENQLNTLLGDYKNKYGVELKIDDLDTELTKLVAKKEAEFNKLSQGIALIKEGKYAEADELLNGKKAEPITNGDVVKGVVENKEPEVVAEAPIVEAPKVEEPKVETPATPPTAEETKADDIQQEVVAENAQDNAAVPVEETKVEKPIEAPVTEADVPAPPTPPASPVAEPTNVGVSEEAPTETVAPPVAPPPTAPSAPTTTEAKVEDKPADNTIPGQTPLTPPTSNPSSFGAIFGGTTFSL